MAFVLDASVAAAWAFDDENHPRAAAAFFRHIGDEGAEAPSIWWCEIRKTVIVNERRGRISHNRSL